MLGKRGICERLQKLRVRHNAGTSLPGSISLRALEESPFILLKQDGQPGLVAIRKVTAPTITSTRPSRHQSRARRIAARICQT